MKNQMLQKVVEIPVTSLNLPSGISVINRQNNSLFVPFAGGIQSDISQEIDQSNED